VVETRMTATLTCVMIRSRQETDINNGKIPTWSHFIAAAALIVGSANMGFQQGQSNPDVKSFFPEQFPSRSRHQVRAAEAQRPLGGGFFVEGRDGLNGQ
jgi:hypothetical protein